jgi:hypothetical protein
MRLGLIALAAFTGLLVGIMVGPAMSRILPLVPREAARPEALPLPHHVPTHPGGVSLRFAMVHDVIHERFPRHGTAYYQERNRRANEALKELKAHSTPDGKAPEKYFPLIDDLAVGLEFTGKHEEAITLMRDKLKQQEKLGLKGRDLYSTYANLGTFLILGPFRKVRPGSEEDKLILKEGLDDIKKAIAVYPQSHFGREIWQAVIIEYMIALLDNPGLLLRFDMIGDRVDREVNPGPNRSVTHIERFLAVGGGRELALAVERESLQPRPVQVTSCITKVGAEEGWSEAVKSSQPVPAPFDEPALGIVGMWRLGGGAHPIFAKALGEIMMRVGQRYIAWCAYERAIRLVGHVWPDPKIQEKFAEQCRRRQALIEGQLPRAEVADLRPRFEEELAYGQKYQEDYQLYEARSIAAGKSLDDPHFYDQFNAEHEPIASPVGAADVLLVEPHTFFKFRVPLASMILYAGLFAFGTACLLRVVNKRYGGSTTRDHSAPQDFI